MKVFISYAKDNLEVAKRLRKDLDRNGIQPWLDEEDLLPGQNWKKVISREIKDSKYFLALLSSKSLSTRGFVQKELKIALDMLDEFPEDNDSIFVIPVRVDKCEPADEALQNIRMVDLFPSYENGLNKLLRVLAPDHRAENEASPENPPVEAAPIINKVPEEEPQKLNRDKIFISYCQKDKEWLERVQTHLNVLKHLGVTTNVWADTKIKAGQEWSKEIRNALSSAKVAIFLISTDFLASDFINKEEIPPLLDAAKNDGAVILPLILKPCLFEDFEISKFQAVNKPSEPLSDMKESDQDKVLLQLARRIKELIQFSKETAQ